MAISKLNFPGEDYKVTLQKVVAYFKEYPGVYAIVLTGSLARGKAVKESCIDMYTFLDKKHLKTLASDLASRIEAYSRLGGRVCFYKDDIEGGIVFGDVRVDIGFTDGNFKPCRENSFDITRDDFETTIGNLFAYSVSLHQKSPRYQRLRQKYLPFYDDDLRKARLAGTAEEFDYKIWKTRWLAERGEYFAALDALLEAQRIFLQHLFIQQRKYPIDYVKWLKEQCSEILAMPNLYKELTSIVNGIELTKSAVVNKSNLLEKLFKKYRSHT